MKLLILALCTSARADPIVLKADALATTAAPAGLVTVQADGSSPGLSAEALVWTGAATIGDTAHADVLVIALRAVTPDGQLAGRFGRFIESLGALRPVQIDGAAGRVQLPMHTVVEVYAGVPVVADLATSRAWDWAVGGRVAEKLGDSGSVGVAYAEQREDGRLVSEEVGVDGGESIGKRDDLGVRLAYDLANPGLAEASLSASHRFTELRVEVYSSFRAASHLLPATSLFTVLGDTPAERLGTTLTWKFAPRLDLGADLGVRYAAGDAAPEVVLRAKLRLDERGISALSCELRRDGVGADQWTGARGVARLALPYSFTFSTELELVIPDHDTGLGAVWPWGLVALGWSTKAWQVAVAAEASASPTDRDRLDVLAQVGHRWGTP